MGIGVNTPKDSKQDSTDILLLLGGLVVAGVGLSWLLLSKPWELLSSDERVVAPPVVVATTEPSVAPPAAGPALETTLDNPLMVGSLSRQNAATRWTRKGGEPIIVGRSLGTTDNRTNVTMANCSDSARERTTFLIR